ncbi:MAG TPA: imidazole glycerol phosphate synthase subunit HisF [Desulfobacteraceae bacterium]|nr:imidazole glycerol phosphate synthase subunit HisF [Desulfobacteraceae bacterium]
MITLLDYGAGNVRSVINALERLGAKVKTVQRPEDISSAEKLVFPGVGAFGNMMHVLNRKGYVSPLISYITAGRPFLGICLGLQALFDGSEEDPGVPGLGIIPGIVKRFGTGLPVPHIGWNGFKAQQPSILFRGMHGDEKFYFVHSYHAVTTDKSWVLSTTDYGGKFVSAVQRGPVAAVQFHPEKSGTHGLGILKNFLEFNAEPVMPPTAIRSGPLAKRIIACLDVRTDEGGRLVVTKGDRYDVRENGLIRNLGKPEDLAKRYYEEGADEITFLNITGFRNLPLKDMPMLDVLKRTSENVFVPLTIGGGIRDYTDLDGIHYSALEMAEAYFRSGADKISIGSEAVNIVETCIETGRPTGRSAIEGISRIYGSQAVVISIDPRRVYVSSPEDVPHHVIETVFRGPRGERYCWYQCTTGGGRQKRDLDAVTVARMSEKLGAGEILLNCIDRDGTNEGFDLELINAVTDNVGVPVIASSGAGAAQDFFDVFTETRASAALAAGVFHRGELSIKEVKKHLSGKVEVRSI